MSFDTLYFVATYPYFSGDSSSNHQLLRFNQGAIFLVEVPRDGSKSHQNGDWMWGTTTDGSHISGWFPTSYVRPTAPPPSSNYRPASTLPWIKEESPREDRKEECRDDFESPMILGGKSPALDYSQAREFENYRNPFDNQHLVAKPNRTHEPLHNAKELVHKTGKGFAKGWSNTTHFFKKRS